MSATIVERQLQEQRARLVASIMTHAERQIYAGLSAGQRDAFRKKVLESVGVFYDFCLDTMRVLQTVAEDEGTVFNEEGMRLLGEIHQALISGKT